LEERLMIWSIAVDKPFTPELRNVLTRKLQRRGFRVQWRKWGLLDENDVHIDTSYAPVTLE